MFAKNFPNSWPLMALVIVVGVSLSALGFKFSRDWGEEREQARFDKAADTQFDRVVDSFRHGLDNVFDVSILFAASETVKREEFATFSNGISKKRGNFSALSWVPRVPLAERTSFEERARNEVPGFRVTERGAPGTMVPAARRAESFPVYYLEPMKGNEAAFGFDLASEPVRLETLQLARDSGELRITPRLSLVQDTGRRYGFVAFMPVYRKAASLASVAERRASFEGFVTGVFYVSDVVEKLNSRLPADRDNTNIILFDLSAAPGAQLLYPQSSPFRKPEDIGAGLHYSRTFELGERKWLAVVMPGSMYGPEPFARWLPWAVLAGGIFLTGLLSFSVFTGLARLAQANSMRDLYVLHLGIMDNVTDGIIVIDDRGVIETASTAVGQLFGYSGGELIGRNVKILMPEPERSRHDTYIANYNRTGIGKILGIGPREVTGQRKDGTAISLDIAISEMRLGDKRKFIGVLRDVTERKRVEERLTLTAERLALATESAEIGIWDWDIVTDTLVWDKRMYALYGVREEDFGGAYAAWAEVIHPDDKSRAEGEVRAAIAGSGEFDTWFRVVWPDGQIRYIAGHGKAVRAPDGTAIRLTGINRDITESKMAEEELSQSEQRFRGIFANASVGIVVNFLKGRGRQYNPAMARLTGYAQEELRGVRLREIIHPEDRGDDGFVDAMLKNNIDRRERDFRLFRKDGHILWFHQSAALVRDADGIPEYSISLFEDITDRKVAEEKLLQSQKMEAVGQLTGGIAHDFNNLLTVILGNLELLGLEIDSESKQAQFVSRAASAARRGADLTGRLLAFSRIQTLAPEVLDLNQNVCGMGDLLHRTLGENIVIEILTAGDLWATKVDPNQFENAVLNLAVNARDAMPAGGKLTIATANVHLDGTGAAGIDGLKPGDYVMVAVSDTGIGMSPEVMKRVFEPFFTTKEVGKGTGLGLAMVHGFVRQSGGHVTIESRQGVGTVVKLYFPRTNQGVQVGGPAKQEMAESAAVPRGTETILVVEDDADVRHTAVAMLEGLGYRIFEADNGPSALNMLKEHPEVDLLFTDVAMPGGMNGVDLEYQARRWNPAIRVLFTSGYPAQAFVQNVLSERKINLLSKPYREKELAQKIREVLRGSGGSAGR